MQWMGKLSQVKTLTTNARQLKPTFHLQVHTGLIFTSSSSITIQSLALGTSVYLEYANWWEEKKKLLGQPRIWVLFMLLHLMASPAGICCEKDGGREGDKLPSPGDFSFLSTPSEPTFNQNLTQSSKQRQTLAKSHTVPENQTRTKLKHPPKTKSKSFMRANSVWGHTTQLLLPLQNQQLPCILFVHAEWARKVYRQWLWCEGKDWLFKHPVVLGREKNGKKMEGATWKGERKNRRPWLKGECLPHP